MPVKPITPAEVLEQGTLIPDDVFEIVNALLVEMITPAKEVVIETNALAKLVAERMNISRNEVFEKNMLDFEDDYKKAGWTVKHESPDRGEDFKSFFRFTFKG